MFKIVKDLPSSATGLYSIANTFGNEKHVTVRSNALYSDTDNFITVYKAINDGLDKAYADLDGNTSMECISNDEQHLSIMYDGVISAVLRMIRHNSGIYCYAPILHIAPSQVDAVEGIFKETFRLLCPLNTFAGGIASKRDYIRQGCDDVADIQYPYTNLSTVMRDYVKSDASVLYLTGELSASKEILLTAFNQELHDHFRRDVRGICAMDERIISTVGPAGEYLTKDRDVIVLENFYQVLYSTEHQVDQDDDAPNSTDIMLNMMESIKGKGIKVIITTADCDVSFSKIDKRLLSPEHCFDVMALPDYNTSTSTRSVH